MTAKLQKVPILAYHSIADDHDHLLRHLSQPVQLFERQLRYLRRNAFQTVSLYDVYAHLREGAPLPPRAIALTFDDGYLDNWVHAYPLLKKYEMQATIFVATDFVDPRDCCRPNLEDVSSGRIPRHGLEWWGHLSWPELKKMLASGLIDVQSHTKTHTWHYVSENIIDFHHPADDYHWLYWNTHPEEKHGWLTRDFREAIPWGTPVYEFEQTLLERRYFEDPQVTEVATGYVARNGVRDFFSRSHWRDELFEVVRAHRARKASQGHNESEEEHTARIRDELVGSRRILEARLQKPVDFLCWPCGDYTEKLQRFAIEECGYLATVNLQKTTNRFGDDPTQLRRVVFGQDYQGPFKSQLIFLNFYGTVNYQSGESTAYPMAPISRRLMRVGNLLRYGIRRHRAAPPTAYAHRRKRL